ncbi:MAG: hypothetical protein AAF391_12030, partial [Bacteroidota bacterium]
GWVWIVKDCVLIREDTIARLQDVNTFHHFVESSEKSRFNPMKSAMKENMFSPYIVLTRSLYMRISVKNTSTEYL